MQKNIRRTKSEAKKVFLFIISFMMVILTLGSCKLKCKHKWEDHVITAVTCTENGSTEQKCTLCGETKTIEVLALGHDMQNINAKAATCTEAGYDAYQQCSRCEYNTKGTEIPALNHEFSEEWSKDETNHWHECTRENCTEKNDDAVHTDTDDDHICNTCNEKISDCSGGTATCQNKAICSVCGHEYGEKDFTNHVETGEVIWVIKDGKHSKQWNCCETKITDETEHNFNKTVVDNKYLVSNASCTAAAKYYYSCECGEKGTETFSNGTLLAHTFDTWNEGKDATCTEDGVKPHKDCTVCGKHFNENDVEITDIVIVAEHNFNTDSWTADITGHYYACNREGCTEKLDFGVHDFENGICDICDAHNTFGTEGLTYTYNSTTQTYSVLAYKGEELDVVIPYYHNDGTNGEHKVTEIGAGAFTIGSYVSTNYANNNNITSVVIPNSITIIAKYAFKNCTQIANVVIPNSVTSIDQEAFYSCSNLESFTMTQNLEVAGEFIFTGTAWYNNQPAGLLYIDKYLYGYKGTATENQTVIKEGTVGIFPYAFAYQNNIKSIVFPSSLSWIGSFAFYYCPGISSLNIPVNISRIDSSAFSYMTYLEEIIVNNPNTEFGSGIFADAGSKINEKKILKITLPEGMKKIPKSMFYGSAITTIDIPSTVTEICDEAFRFCDRLTSFVIDEQITHIGKMVFANCKNLISVTIPEGVQVISDEVFFQCSKLMSITLPWTLEEIRTKAKEVEKDHWFTSMDKEFVIHYDGGSFKPYHALVEQLCTTDGSVEYWEEILTGKKYKESGYYNEIKDIVIPAGCKGGTATCEEKAICENCGNEYGEPLGHNTGPWQEDETGHWKVCRRTDCGKHFEYNEHTYVEGICTTCQGKDLYGTEGLEFSGSSVKSYTGTETTVKIPYFYYNEHNTLFTITEIGNSAFKDNTTIETVIFPGGVKTIKSDAFANCTNLKNISLENITEFSYRSFAGCTSLKNVTLSNQLKTITSGLFRNCTGLEEINIPSSVTKIENVAFLGCTGLEEINIPSGVTRIESSAFEGCSNVTKVTIPSTVSQIDGGAFYDCTAITGLYISDLGSWASVDCAVKTSNPLYYAKHLYLNGVLVTELVLPEGQKTVGSYTFVNCIDFTNIIIPNTVTYVGSSPFAGCYNVESMTTPISGGTAYDKPIPFAFYFGKEEYENSVLVDFDEGFSTISESDYYLPIALKTVHINGSEIVNSAFRNHNTLETITFDNVTSIGETAFGRCYKLTSVTLPETLTTIGTDAFVLCYKLVEIRNNSNIELTIGSTENGGVSRYALGIITGDEPSKIAKDENGFITHTDGSELTIVDYRGDNRFITLPEGTTKIHRNCFELSNIISVTFSSSLKSIGSLAFENCYNLIEVIVNDELETIGDYAFYSCYNLMSFTLPASMQTIGTNAFSKTEKLIEVVNLSSLTITSGQSASGSGGLGKNAKNIITNPDNTKLSKDENGFVTYTDGEEKILVAYLGSETEITIQEDITSIYKYAFSYNNNITKVVIPETVTSIGDYAFYGTTKLETINLPENLLYLGISALSKATSLKSIVIPASIGTINETTFYGCSNLTDVTISNGITLIENSAFYECISLTEITIPSSVKIIEASAFGGCALTEVRIPEGVETIKDRSFGTSSYYANSIITVYIPVSLTTIKGFPFTNSVKEVYYAGTKEQFLEIDFDDYWYYRMGDDLVIKCTDCEMTKAEYNTIFIELMKEKEQQ